LWTSLVVDDAKDVIYNKCWYTTIVRHAKSAQEALKDGDVHLPDPIEAMLSRIAAWMLVGSGSTPTLLPFDAFKEVWWQSSNDRERTQTAHKLLEQLTHNDKQTLLEMENRQVPKVDKQEILLHFPHSDHRLRGATTQKTAIFMGYIV
jgi:hypothetical protein